MIEVLVLIGYGIGFVCMGCYFGKITILDEIEDDADALTIGMGLLITLIAAVLWPMLIIGFLFLGAISTVGWLIKAVLK